MPQKTPLECFEEQDILDIAVNNLESVLENPNKNFEQAFQSWQKWLLLDNQGMTLLNLAVKYGNSEVMNWLIDHGADYTVCDKEGRNLLMYALKYPMISGTEELYIDIPKMQRTITSNIYSYEIIERLLKLGISPAQLDNNGNNSLFYIGSLLDRTRYDIYRNFLDWNENSQSAKNLLIDLQQYNNQMITEIIRLATDDFKNINALNNKGQTILNSNPVLFPYWLTFGPDPSSRTWLKDSLSHILSKMNQIIWQIKDHSKQTDILDNDEQEIVNSNEETIIGLKSLRLDPNHFTGLDDSLVGVLLEFNCKEIHTEREYEKVQKILKEIGWNINSQDHQGKTVLMHAALSDSHDIDDLIKLKPNVNLLSDSNNSALSYALMQKMHDFHSVMIKQPPISSFVKYGITADTINQPVKNAASYRIINNKLSDEQVYNISPMMMAATFCQSSDLQKLIDFCGEFIYDRELQHTWQYRQPEEIYINMFMVWRGGEKLGRKIYNNKLKLIDGKYQAFTKNIYGDNNLTKEKFSKFSKDAELLSIAKQLQNFGLLDKFSLLIADDEIIQLNTYPDVRVEMMAEEFNPISAFLE